MYRTDKHRRIVESLRVMLAIIAGLLMLDERQEGRQELSIAVIAFSIYAITLLWQAANGSLNAQRRVYYWLDSCWFLLLLYLADNSGTHYFLFLLFPVFFAAWRADYREVSPSRRSAAPGRWPFSSSMIRSFPGRSCSRCLCRCLSSRKSLSHWHGSRKRRKRDRSWRVISR
jgi:hypothetical protein